MIPGAAGDVSPANLGRVGNASFIVGDGGVIVIDTGTSYRHGVALLQAIRRVTDLPIRLAIITHRRQEFLFGAKAFQDRGIPIHMHRDAAELMAARCETCLKNLKAALGDEEMCGTVVPKADVEFGGSHTLDAIGRPVRVLAYGLTSGPGAVAVLDERTGVLFAGGMLDEHRIPEVNDAGDMTGWLRALQALRRERTTVVVPAHGPATTMAAAEGIERYLSQLQARARELLREGVRLDRVPERAALPDFADWDGYGTIHPRNATFTFLRMEREQVEKR